MKSIKFYFSLFAAIIISTSFTLAQEYLIQEDFEGGASDNFPGWTVGGEGVAATASGITGMGAKFRGITSSLETNSSFSFVDELIFSLKLNDPSFVDSNVTFKIFTSLDDGITWDSIWGVVLDTIVSKGIILDSTLNIDSDAALKIKFESNIPGGTIAGEYPFTLDDVFLTKKLISETNTDIAFISASCNTVSEEEISFSKNLDGVFVANDSVAFDEDNIFLSCSPLHANASVVFTKQANPLPGKSDTAIFKVTAADGIASKEYRAVISKSLFQCKIGFLTSGGDVPPTGWSTEGGNYASSSRGDGGLFPGTNGMRIYNSTNKGLGILTSPEYSSISSLSFAAKFSLTSDESLIIKKSTDAGTSWTDVKTFSPSGGEIPSYSTEKAEDILAVQNIDINEVNVMISFNFIGSSTTARLMIDDIACKSKYDPNERYNFSLTVYDIDNNLLEGATVTFLETQEITGSNGMVTFTDVPFSSNSPYSISKDEKTFSGEISVASNTSLAITFLTEEIDLFLALGQSNMAGRAPINEYVNQEIEGVSLLNEEDVWTPAMNPMNLYSNIRKDISMQQVGPSYSFSKTLAKYVDNRIGMVVNARGGTSMSEFATGIYHDPIMMRIDATNVYGKIKGVIWHQGESDSNRTAVYMGRLNTLVNDVRAEIGDEVYFLAAQLGPWDDTDTSLPKYGVFNDTISKIANYISNSDYVINDNLTHIGDNTHFNLKSQILLGQRYAQKMLEKIYAISISIVELNVTGSGYILFDDDSITSSNSFSYTTIANESPVFSIYAGEGKEFAQLLINGIPVEEAAELTIYDYSFIASSNSVLSIEITVRDNTTDVIESILSEPLFYPNPASDNILIIGSEGEFSVSIYDLSGRLVLFKENESNIDIQKLFPGPYTVIMNSKQTQKIQKLMKL